MNPTTKKALILAFMIGFILSGLAITTSPVSAALRICRTDPILTFSDGSKMTVTSTIDTDESNIASVVYSVHAPAGLGLDKTTYTAGGLGGREKVGFFADQPAGVFKVDTFVTLLVGSVPVSTTVDYQAFELIAGGTSGSHFVITLNTNPLPVTLTKPAVTVPVLPVMNSSVSRALPPSK
jgi:hypothetical protein